MTKPSEEAARRATASDGRVIPSQQAGDVSKTGQAGASPAADREFLFEYRYGGATWGITIFARDPAQAREKIKAVALARYKGEKFAKIALSGGNLIRRLLGW